MTFLEFKDTIEENDLANIVTILATKISTLKILLEHELGYDTFKD